MRLTELTNKGMNGTPIYVGSYGNIVNVGDNQATSMVHGKLGQLEDIEEEIGIDLIVLFEALKNGIYIKELKNDCPYWDFELRNVSGLGLVIFWGFCGNLFLKDYGKTWALTKEELWRQNNFE